jgi:hypothetical protein
MAVDQGFWGNALISAIFQVAVISRWPLFLLFALPLSKAAGDPIMLQSFDLCTGTATQREGRAWVLAVDGAVANFFIYAISSLFGSCTAKDKFRGLRVQCA